MLVAPGDPALPGFTVKGRANNDDVPHPAGEKRREMRKMGLEEKVRAEAQSSSQLSGQTFGQGSRRVHRLGRGKYKGKYIELERERPLLWDVGYR